MILESSVTSELKNASNARISLSASQFQNSLEKAKQVRERVVRYRANPCNTSFFSAVLLSPYCLLAIFRTSGLARGTCPIGLGLMSDNACSQQLPAKRGIIPIEVSNEGGAGCCFALDLRRYGSPARSRRKPPVQPEHLDCQRILARMGDLEIICQSQPCPSLTSQSTPFGCFRL